MNNTEFLNLAQKRFAQKRFMYKLPVSTTNRCYSCIHKTIDKKLMASSGIEVEAYQKEGSPYTESSLPLFYDCVKLEIIIGAPKQSRCPLHKEI